MKRSELKVGMEVAVGGEYPRRGFVVSTEPWKKAQGYGRFSFPKVVPGAGGVAVAVENRIGQTIWWGPSVANLSKVRPWAEHEAAKEAALEARLTREQAAAKADALLHAKLNLLPSELKAETRYVPGYGGPGYTDTSRVVVNLDALLELLDR